MKAKQITNNSLTESIDTESINEEQQQTQPKEIKQNRQLKTQPERLDYLRERKAIGRNEESQIMNALQYILIMKHDVQFEYKHEKRSKKTTKFHCPQTITYNGIEMSMESMRQFGILWLTQNGYPLTADGNINSLKELQRTKEAEVNAAIIYLLDSLGYSFQFKQWKEKLNRRTSPFIKVLSLYSPHGYHYTTEILKDLGKLFDSLYQKTDERY